MKEEDAIERLRKIADRMWLSPREHMAMNMAIKALQAQTAKKPVKTDSTDEWACPECHTIVGYHRVGGTHKLDFCGYCGQRLEW